MAIPFETRKTYEKTVEVNRAANVQYPNIGFFFPFEGTELRDISIKEGYFKDDAVKIYDHGKPALIFKDIGEREFIEMRNVFTLYVKLPESYKKYIRRSEICDEIGISLRKMLIEIFDKTVFDNDGWYVDDGLHDQYIEKLDLIINVKV